MQKERRKATVNYERSIKLASLATAALMGLVASASATITFSAANGSLAASAEFEVVGANNLQVTLSNTSATDVLVPADVLTAVFFDLAGTPTLTPVSALLAAGSTVYFGSTGGGNVGGEWGYKSGLSGAPNGAKSGISSSGLSPLFGAANFNGANLQGPAGLDGLQYGLLSGSDDITTGNAPVTGGYALIQSSVIFTLSGLPTGFRLDKDISNVSFQYGTSLAEPNVPIPPIPEPSTVLAGALLLLPFGLSTLRVLRGNRK